MRQLAPVLALIVLAPFAVAQDNQPVEEPPTAESRSHDRYVVHLTEYRLGAPIDLAKSSQDVLRAIEQQRQEGQAELVETIRLTALEEYESMIQFGRSVFVTTDVTTTPRGRAQNLQERQVGTLVRLNARRAGERILVALSYEASRLEGDGKVDTDGQAIGPPDTVTFEFTTTLILNPNETVLVGQGNTDTSRILALRIER
jgi:hypothetical protein